MHEPISVTPIGIVKNGIPPGTCGEMLRRSEATILVDERFTTALKGIERYSHIVVTFWMHEVPEEKRGQLLTLLPYAPDAGVVGVFASRVPWRPSPIGISVVRFRQRIGRRVLVCGLDARNGSPVLDIKPYTGHALERPGTFTLPDWEA